jgi:hypothetical protein
MNRIYLSLVLVLFAGVTAACQVPGLAGSPDVPGSSVAPAPTPQEFEAALLEDGLTFEEYETAFLAFVECAAGFGYKLQSDPVLTSRKNYEYQLGRKLADGESEQRRQDARAGFEACRVRHFDAVQRQWVIQTAMNEAELQEARDHLGACMRAAGYDVPEHPAQENWTGYVRVIEGADPAPREAFRRCLPLTQQAFGMRSSEVP